VCERTDFLDASGLIKRLHQWIGSHLRTDKNLSFECGSTGHSRSVNPCHLASILGASAAAALAIVYAPAPSASAAPAAANGACPDAEVVFARGTNDPPGLGDVGQAYVDSLRSKLDGKSLGVYPVNYPASMDFSTGLDGINDAGTHVEQMATNCPNTKMVLGGYSQGAAVMGFVTSATVPNGAPANAPQPMPTDVANHVAAVTLFGTPSSQFMNMVGQPPIAIGPLYAAKTQELCAPGDPVCSDGGDWAAHDHAYVNSSVIDQGAAFAASHI
jgi:cutinase